MIAIVSAPVAPGIMPGLPPNAAANSPMMKAAYRPTSGCTCATKATAMAYGIRASATVRPLSTPSLIRNRQ